MRRLTQIPAGVGRSCVPRLLYASGAAVGPPSFLVLLVKDQLHPRHGPPVGGGRDGLLDGGTHTHTRTLGFCHFIPWRSRPWRS